MILEGGFPLSQESDIKLLIETYDAFQNEPSQRLIRVLEDLADRGSSLSMIYVAEAYENGAGVAVDSAKAVEWYRRAMDSGSNLASYYLGHLFLKKENYVRALEAFSVGALDSFPPSLYRAAKMHLDGLGCERDVGLALRFLEEASEKGHVFAKRALAAMCFRGEFVPRNLIRGISLLASAVKAILVLGITEPDSDLLRA